jgi:hypothetical protein
MEAASLLINRIKFLLNIIHNINNFINERKKEIEILLFGMYSSFYLQKFERI